MGSLATDRLGRDPSLLRPELVATLEQRRGPSPDRCQRGAQLVRYGRDEVFLQLLDLADLGDVSRDDDEGAGGAIGLVDAGVGAGQPPGGSAPVDDLEVAWWSIRLGPALQQHILAVDVAR